MLFLIFITFTWFRFVLWSWSGDEKWLHVVIAAHWRSSGGVFFTVSPLSESISWWFWPLQENKYPTSWGNECLRSSLLPRYTDGDHSELQDGFYWPVFIYSRMIKLVTNLCFSIFCGVMRFAGSRWSIFFNKTTKRAKSSFSSSVVGKACRKKQESLTTRPRN